MMKRILCLVLATLLHSATASAQPPAGDEPPDAKPASAPSAVDLAKEAKAHYDRGEWAAALTLFEKAERLTHSPVLVLYAARCNRNLKRLTEARTLYEKVAAEPLADDAALPFRNAQKEAKTDLESLVPRIPKLQLDRDAAPSQWIVRVDDQVITDDLLVSVDPGEHRVSATDNDEQVFSQTIVVAEGATETVVIKPGAKVVDPGNTGKDTSTSTAAQYAPGLALIGTGAAALGVGIVLRVLAIQQVEDVKGRCVGGTCLAEDEAEINEAVTFETVSTVLFIAGGALAATGIVLLVVLPGDDDDDTPEAAFSVGPASLHFRASF